jgi:hypothetical protein
VPSRDAVSGHVAAVVLAAMGGARLERSLASVAWVPERVVLDLTARVDGRELPAGVRYVAGPAPLIDLASADWLLLLLEGEMASPRLAEALVGLHADVSDASAFTVRVEMHAIGTRWTARPAVRLAARAAATLVVRDGRPELAAEGVPLPLAEASIVVEAPPSLEAAVQALDAESAAVAAWLHRGGLRVKVRHLLLPPLATVARVLVAHGGSTRPWARWVAAVFAGYRTLLVPAKVWELRQLAAVRPPHAGGT